MGEESKVQGASKGKELLPYSMRLLLGPAAQLLLGPAAYPDAHWGSAAIRRNRRTA